ncbi:ras-related protein RABH1b [Artemisia annua]|uniref:Ras-related protein RABH1b n=1 Tax=Artemisia annua TaxID=35608 RepID=A0A2U1Q9G6_ARTAN|nr:ras-related protein RABH1b [Artemisia annua]
MMKHEELFTGGSLYTNHCCKGLNKFNVLFVSLPLVVFDNIITVKTNVGDIGLWEVGSRDSQKSRSLESASGGLRFEKVTDAEVGSNIISTESKSADFLDTRKWIEEVRADRGSDVIIVLVGKKIDIVDKRKVSVEEGEAKATELKGIFTETKGELDTKIKDRKYELLRTQEIV